jgi:hypothetical protein
VDQQSKLEEVARRVRDLTPARVAEWAELRPRKVSRFVNAPQSITYVELERIKAAIARIERADEVARDAST